MSALPKSPPAYSMAGRTIKDFEALEQTLKPGPAAYDVTNPSVVKPKSPAFSMSGSRPKSIVSPKEKHPSPAEYSPDHHKIIARSPSFSMKGRVRSALLRLSLAVLVSVLSLYGFLIRHPIQRKQSHSLRHQERTTSPCLFETRRPSIRSLRRAPILVLPAHRPAPVPRIPPRPNT